MNQKIAVDYMAERKEFKASALTGTLRPMGTGRLDSPYLETFKADLIAMDYLVYSYGTPIAWHTPNFGWFVVSQKFSSTTSKHQNRVRQAVAKYLSL